MACAFFKKQGIQLEPGPTRPVIILAEYAVLIQSLSTAIRPHSQCSQRLLKWRHCSTCSQANTTMYSVSPTQHSPLQWPHRQMELPSTQTMLIGQPWLVNANAVSWSGDREVR